MDYKKPFRMTPRARSNSDLFAKRGDPWATDKEGMRLYGRNLESENPDYDQYFAKKAPVEDRKTVGGVPIDKAKPDKSSRPVAAVKRANAMMKLRSKMRGD